MDGSIRLSSTDRKALLHVVRRGTDGEQRLRAHILLLLDDPGAPGTPYLTPRNQRGKMGRH